MAPPNKEEANATNRASVHDERSNESDHQESRHTLRFFDDTHIHSLLGGVQLEVVHRMTDILPKDFAVYKVLGVGANNRALKVQWDGAVRVLRVPRRTSDTRQRGNAKWEFAHTARASALQCAPTLYRAWYMRHAEDEKWPSGLYFLMEYFHYDLQKVFRDDSLWDLALAHRETIGRGIVDALTTLSNDELLVYDLKPSNVVLRFEGEDHNNYDRHATVEPHSSKKECAKNTTRGNKDKHDRKSAREQTTTRGVTVRIIDFGRDFCEWGGASTLERDKCTPIIDILRRTIVAEDVRRSVQDKNNSNVGTHALHRGDMDERLRHIVFATMIVNLSATTTRHLYHERKRTRMVGDLRRDMNPIAPLCRTLVSSMQGRNIHLLRLALRYDEVRGVLEHYHGRRNAGTKRTLRFASGEE